MKILKCWTALFMVISAFPVVGQDLTFSQFYSSPVQLNPALAGQIEECARISTNYRNQWPSIPNAFQTYQLSYDQSIPSTSSSFGVIVNSDRQGDNAYVVNQVGGIFAYQFRATRKMIVSGGLQATYFENRLNYDELIFADQISFNGNQNNFNSSFTDEYVSFMDFSGGIAFDYDGKIYGGFAVHHMAEPSNAFTELDDGYLPMRITFHGGTIFEHDPAVYDKKSTYFSPNFLYTKQGNFHQLNLGLYTQIKPLTFGLWYRHNFENPDAAIILLGLQFDKVKLGYSYDYALSSLSGNAGGAHEISLSYRFCIYVEKSKKVRAIKCPEF